MSIQRTVTVRARQTEDLPALGQVLVRVHQVDGYPVEGVTDPEAWLTPPREIAAWTALLDDQPVGQVSLTHADPQDDAAQVWTSTMGRPYTDMVIPVRLFVDPTYRTQGAGRQLMVAAHEHAAALGKHLVFDVMLKDEKAIRLYEALGCKRLSSITHHHGNGLEEPAAVYVAPDHLANTGSTRQARFGDQERR